VSYGFIHLNVGILYQHFSLNQITYKLGII